MPWTVGLPYFCLIPLAFAQYAPASRWAQATAYLGNVLFVHGGLSDPYDSYSYTSAPAVSDLLSLDLSTSFSTSAPPWNLLTANLSPAVAWHTLSAFNTTDLLLFGGQPGPNSQIVLTTLNDSAALLSVTSATNSNFSIEPQDWANEPMRRMRHASSTIDGRVYITGGEKADGSGSAFSEHYVFNPVAAEFSPLPSSINSPPDIYGHSSLVLPDSRLVVLGGYCASCGQLVPLNTIWSLDTTNDDSDWELLVVSNTSLPVPRREFVAVSLPNGNILIHGGADALLQQTYSDGWILETGTTPMTWKSVEALSQVGARKNHFAAQAGGFVLFGFGYGSSAPASTSLFIYDPTSSAMTSSYSAPSNAVPTHQSLSHPTQTGFSGPLGTGTTGSTGTTSGNAPPGQVTSSYPLGSQEISGNGSSQTLAIALGTAFGFLGLVSGVAVLYFAKRKHGGNGPGRFVLLQGDLEDGSGEAGSASGIITTMVNNRATRFCAITFSNVLAYIGLSRGPRNQHRPRRDMFADEDARSFTWGNRLMMHREGSEATSAWTLRSMGALVRGMMSREPSASGTGGDRSDGLSRTAGDRDELIASEKSKRVWEGPHRGSGAEGAYTDPFADPQTDDDYPWLDLRPGILERDEEYDGPVGRDMSLEEYDLTPAPLSKIPSAITFPLRTLSPLKQVTHTSASNQPSSLHTSLEPFIDNQPSLASEPNSPVSSTTPHAFYTPSLGNSSCSPPLLKSNSPLSRPVHRSNSWWARFAKTSLLERRGSITSNNSKPLIFRDPNPAPPLSIIEEASTFKHLPTESKDGAEIYESTPPKERHTRSIASAHSMRTANTESVERLGGSYDVVQRALSEASASRHTLASSTLETAATSTVIESERKHGLLAVNRISEATGDESTPSHSSSFEGSVSSFPPQAVVSTGSTKMMWTGLNTSSRSPLAKSAIQDDHSSPPTLPTDNNGSEVLHKIHAYERRLSQDLESQLSSPPRNTRKREEVPSRSRPTIKYGLAPRASLYVANPDAAHQDPLT
ncbi:hypothetical protein EV401DRAFT_2066580 [Pisolithus croceorrhizus]|nr:hypothetical protein EV401DRAFT_2066580 [Pisolithus croceorrhizus]